MKDRGIKYSVIVPVYNGEKTLETCLNALKKQTVAKNEYEIIVIDDGSKDRSGDIAKAQADKYFFQKNQGPATARNLGAKKAKGEIILFTDSDCEPQESWLEEMIRPFLENSEIVGVKGAYLTKQKNIMARFVQMEYENRYRFMKKYQYIDFIDTYAAAYKRDIFLKFGGFDSQFRIAMTEDTELSYRIANARYKMIFNPKAIVYHSHPTSFFYYFKRKYRAAFWRMLAVKKNINKIKGDTHTPNDIKSQIASLFLVFLGFILFMFTQAYAVLIFGLILFLLSCLTYLINGLKNDSFVAILSPFIVGIRSVVYSAGLSVGTLKFFLNKN